MKPVTTTCAQPGLSFIRLACAGLLVALASQCFAAPPTDTTNRSPASSAAPDFGTPAEKELCSRNLSRIYAAIQAYRQDHNKDVPGLLSDLVPKYLDDLNVFTCPISRRTGKIDDQGLGDPKLAISYCYQFGNQIVPASFGGDSTHTMREWKLRQMSLAGDMVPLVRCPHHPNLNLSFGGKIYEAPSQWELMMTNGIVPGDLIVKKLFPGTPSKPGSNPGSAAVAAANNPGSPSGPIILRIPTRDPQATAALIDLTDFYNAGLNETWHGQSSNDYKQSDLSWLPKGIQTFAGVEFDVRGVIQLAGPQLYTTRFPKTVKGIKVNRKCRALHFLQATGWFAPFGTQIGHYRVVFADGEDREIPVVYGADVRDWTSTPDKNDVPPPTLVTAWTGKSPSSQSQGTTLSLFKTTWENPLPQIRVESIDYVSAMTNCAPFLISITAE